MVAASIVLHVASYTLTDGRVRPVEIAVVRRITNDRTRRTRVIDAGAATRSAARVAALHFAGGRGDIRETEVDHGSLGIFGLTDDDRDAVLVAISALPITVGGSPSAVRRRRFAPGRGPEQRGPRRRAPVSDAKFPRTHNGYVDTGRPVTKVAKCPNCGGNNYRETVSLEECPDCGLEFSYWGGGGNAVYQAYEADRERREEERERREREVEQDRRDYEEWE